MKCNKCSGAMRKIDRRDDIAELDEGATDGQIADYQAAELSGDRGAWSLGIVEYKCAKCGLLYQLINDQLPSYYPLINAWHEKAAEGDTFSRFVFQYLAFIAHIKNNLFFDSSSDRSAIQRLKRENEFRVTYLKVIKNSEILLKCWYEIISELKVRPLYNNSTDPDYPVIDKWWNNNEDEPNRNNDLPEGKVLSEEDWINMIEYWCSVRNNLFHGGKNPNIGRDAFLVEHAYITLRVFVEKVLLAGH